MTRDNPTSQQPISGSTTFRHVQDNWEDLGAIERVGVAGLVTLVALKNRAERALKNFMFSFFRRR